MDDQIIIGVLAIIKCIGSLCANQNLVWFLYKLYSDSAKRHFSHRHQFLVVYLVTSSLKEVPQVRLYRVMSN